MAAGIDPEDQGVKATAENIADTKVTVTGIVVVKAMVRGIVAMKAMVVKAGIEND
jgi:hypothetical protein